MRPMVRGQLLGLGRPVAVAPRELVEAALLLRSEPRLAVLGGRTMRAKGILPAVDTFMRDRRQSGLGHSLGYLLEGAVA